MFSLKVCQEIVFFLFFFFFYKEFCNTLNLFLLSFVREMLSVFRRWSKICQDPWRLRVYTRSSKTFAIHIDKNQTYQSRMCTKDEDYARSTFLILWLSSVRRRFDLNRVNVTMKRYRYGCFSLIADTGSAQEGQTSGIFTVIGQS